MKDILFYLDELKGTSISINFEDFSKTIESLLTGLNGRPLKVESSDSMYTDTETVLTRAGVISKN